MQIIIAIALLIALSTWLALGYRKIRHYQLHMLLCWQQAIEQLELRNQCLQELLLKPMPISEKPGMSLDQLRDNMVGNAQLILQGQSHFPHEVYLDAIEKIEKQLHSSMGALALRSSSEREQLQTVEEYSEEAWQLYKEAAEGYNHSIQDGQGRLIAALLKLPPAAGRKNDRLSAESKSHELETN